MVDYTKAELACIKACVELRLLHHEKQGNAHGVATLKPLIEKLQRAIEK